MITEGVRTLEYKKDFFRPGDSVICLQDQEFSDGTYHEKNQILVVDEVTVYYYNFHTYMYRKIN